MTNAKPFGLFLDSHKFYSKSTLLQAFSSNFANDVSAGSYGDSISDQEHLFHLLRKRLKQWCV